jgi:hypothetical protein
MAGRDAAPAGVVTQPRTRAASGLRPGSLRTPARSWLMRAGGTQVVPGRPKTGPEKRGPTPE